MKTQNLQNVMVRFGMLENFASDVMAAGFPLIFQSIADQQQLAHSYEEHAKTATPSLDVYRLGRTSSSGVKIADGGYLKFGNDGQEMICPSQLVEDLTKLGFKLVIAEVLKKEGDLDDKGRQRIALRFFFALGQGEKLALTPAQKEVARKYFDQSYHKMWGYFNPTSVDQSGARSQIQGSIVTLNFSGVMKPNVVKGCHDQIRDLRMPAENHFRCLSRTNQSQQADWHPGDTESVVAAAFGHDTREARQLLPSRPTSRATD